MISYAKADKVGLDVEGGKGKRGKQVLIEIIPGSDFLIKQHSKSG
jgi:hypothetical protein